MLGESLPPSLSPSRELGCDTTEDARLGADPVSIEVKTCELRICGPDVPIDGWGENTAGFCRLVLLGVVEFVVEAESEDEAEAEAKIRPRRSLPLGVMAGLGASDCAMKLPAWGKAAGSGPSFKKSLSMSERPPRFVE